MNGGQVVKRYLLITAPTAAGEHTIDASVASDNGSGGKKGGGGGAAETVPDDDLLTVVSSGNITRAGTCTGLASTPSVTADDLVSTSISGGSPSLDIPCPWGFVGENGPSGKSRTGVSFFGFPLTEATDPVTWVITFYSLPAPFHTLNVYFDPNYTGSGPFQAPNTPLARCVTAPAPPAPACLDSLVKDGKGAIATIIAQGTDGDPGAGMG